MQTVKMVISGAVNAGKTEFIKAISEIEVVSTERRANDGYQADEEGDDGCDGLWSYRRRR